MKNGDLPIAPLVNNMGHPYHTSQIAFDNTPLVSGLTKREAFAMAAMQSVILGCAYDECVKSKCRVAVEYADTLLKQLEGG
jgi:hypothetical protein